MGNDSVRMHCAISAFWLQSIVPRWTPQLAVDYPKNVKNADICLWFLPKQSVVFDNFIYEAPCMASEMNLTFERVK